MTCMTNTTHTSDGREAIVLSNGIIAAALAKTGELVETTDTHRIYVGRDGLVAVAI
jgi:hypothetical protein